jgi:hypothetical protein
MDNKWKTIALAMVVLLPAQLLLDSRSPTKSMNTSADIRLGHGGRLATDQNCSRFLQSEAR